VVYLWFTCGLLVVHSSQSFSVVHRVHCGLRDIRNVAPGSAGGMDPRRASLALLASLTRLGMRWLFYWSSIVKLDGSA